jgi:Zn-finger nucleic acid-binding protein
MVCEETAGDASVRVVGGEDSKRHCPVCSTPFLAGIMDDKYRIEICKRCKGILMPRETFAETVIGRRRAAASPPVIPHHTDSRELQRRVRCPGCSAQMVTDWYYGPGNIVLDTCPACDLAWLDAGELQRVVDAPGPDRPA